MATPKPGAPLRALLLLLGCACHLHAAQAAALLPPQWWWLERRVPAAGARPALRAYFAGLGDALCGLTPGDFSQLPVEYMEQVGLPLAALAAQHSHP
jgi:hypothetical protein